MALPTAMFAMIASFGMATAAVVASVDAQRGTHRDSDSKNAIAAADAGSGVALLRLNRFQSSLSAANPCVGPAGEAQTPVEGWCPATPPESVGGATFSYQASAYQEGTPLSVVAVGASDGVSRRVEVGLVSLAGEEVFAEEGLIGQDKITVEGDADIRTNIGTNGEVEKKGNSATICGNIRHGIGHSAPDPDCDGDVTEGNRTLPPVIPPEDIATNNSNCRLAVTCPDPNEVDTYSKKRSSTRPWDAATRTINIAQDATLTMGGGDYWVCRLDIQNGALIMAAGATVRIFFDTPENCGLSEGDVQVKITGSGKIASTGYNPDEGSFAVPGLYVMGSPDITTKVELSGESDGSESEMLLYAPYSDISIGGSATWTGMIAGKSLKVHGEPVLRSNPGMDPPDIFFSGLWERTRYVECSGAIASPPNASC